jgi:hypothetical protein
MAGTGAGEVTAAGGRNGMGKDGRGGVEMPSNGSCLNLGGVDEDPFVALPFVVVDEEVGGAGMVVV